ncbi:hypothetical protein D3C80_2117280 [compost metagenome]
MTIAQHQLGLAATHSLFSLVGDIAHRSFKPHAFFIVEVDQLTLEAWTVEVHQ